MSTIELERGLPCNIEAERLLLGGAMANTAAFDLIEAGIRVEDFSTEVHRKIFRRIQSLRERAEKVDYVSLAEELKQHGELESCGGITYLVELDDGPAILNLDAYARIVSEKATLRRAIFAAQDLIDRCLLEKGNSHDILTDAEAILSKLGEARNSHGQWLNPGEVIEGAGGINAFSAAARGGSGIPTPWPALTTSLCGLQKADLVLVAGRPSMGKTIVGMQMAHHAAKNGHGVAFFSLEMTKEALVRRLIAAVGPVDAQKMRNGCLNADERMCVLRAAGEIENLPLFIDDNRAGTIPAVTAALRKLIARQSVSLVIIDHLQLMKCVGRAESRHHELSEISHSLKHLAGEFGVSVVLLSQLNRECEKEKRRPQLADLKETGSLEEDADVVLFVHRPEQYNRQDPSLHGDAEFIIGKQRNGPTGKLHMVFLHEWQRFEERAGDARQGAF